MKQHKTPQMQTFTALVVTGVLLMGASAVQAQDTGLIPVRAKLGILYPTDTTTRNATGSVHLGGEVDVALPKLFGGKYFVSAGYLEGSDGGNKLRMIPLTIGRYFQAPNPAKSLTGNVYAGAGTGRLSCARTSRRCQRQQNHHRRLWRGGLSVSEPVFR